jgi:hypothetical protein
LLVILLWVLEDSFSSLISVMGLLTLLNNNNPKNYMNLASCFCLRLI